MRAAWGALARGVRTIGTKRREHVVLNSVTSQVRSSRKSNQFNSKIVRATVSDCVQTRVPNARVTFVDCRDFSKISSRRIKRGRPSTLQKQPILAFAAQIAFADCERTRAKEAHVSEPTTTRPDTAVICLSSVTRISLWFASLGTNPPLPAGPTCLKFLTGSRSS